MSKKIHKDAYRGIDFIRISNLPEDQGLIFESWLDNDQVIKIMINNSKILADCVQYHIYEEWYKDIFPSLSADPVKVNGEASSMEDLSVQE